MFFQALAVALSVSMATGIPTGWFNPAVRPLPVDGWCTCAENQTTQYTRARVAATADLFAPKGVISNGEFYKAVVGEADKNSDTRVTRSEFLDDYKTRFPFLRPETVLVMFDLMDGLDPDLGVPVPANHTPPCRPAVSIFSNAGDLGDGELTAEEIDLDRFLHASSRSVEEVQAILDTWLYTALKIILTNRDTPFRVAEPTFPDFDFDLFFGHLDADRDDVITTAELAALLSAISPSGSVSRDAWSGRSVQTYGEDVRVALVFFNTLDTNSDLVLTVHDARPVLTQADANKDGRTVKTEMYRYMQKEIKMIRRKLGLPVKRFVYDCPLPMWNNDCHVVDAALFAMDVDSDFDGIITGGEIKKHQTMMDENRDGEVDRAEFIQFFSGRYAMSHRDANLDFELGDENGDGVFTLHDIGNIPADDSHFACVCDFVTIILSNYKAVHEVAEERHRKMNETMRLFHATKAEVVKTKQMRPSGPASFQPWRTMVGQPVAGQCKTCSGHTAASGDKGPATQGGTEKPVVVKPQPDGSSSKGKLMQLLMQAMLNINSSDKAVENLMTAIQMLNKQNNH